MKQRISTGLLTLLCFSVMLPLNGCKEEDVTEMDLAVNDKTLNLKSKEGSTHVLVWCNGSWSAEFVEPVDWASIESGSGKGDGDFILKYNANPDLLRRCTIRISATGVKEPIDITINQAGEITAPSLKFLSGGRTYIAWEQQDEVEFETNLNETRLKDLKTEVTDNWLENVAIGDGKVTFTVPENLTGAERKSTISLTYEDIDANVYRTVFDVVQTAEQGSLVFEPASMTVDSFEAEKTAACTHNLGSYAADVRADVTYQGGQTGWISDVSLNGNSATFKVAANAQREDRTATISFSMEKYPLSATLEVTQVAFQQELSFEDIKGRLASAGSVTFDGDYIEAVVSGDITGGNTATSPMLSYGSIDKSVGNSTFYISPEDGRCGLRVITVTPDDNVLVRGDKVKLSLAGLTLTREDNPVRYTLTGVTSNSFAKEGTVSVNPVKRTISGISEADIYNLVQIQDVEIAVNFGSYANVNSGWMDAAQKQNAALRMLRDRNGDTINMIVNLDCPWHYTGEMVPRGSGSVNGIVVCDTPAEIPFFRELSGLQIRPCGTSDIMIDKSADNGFTAVVGEWYYPEGSASQYKLAEGTTGKLLASNGEGYVQTSSDIAPKIWNAFYQLSATSDIDGGYRGFRFETAKAGPFWWNSDASKRQTVTIGFPATSVKPGSHPVLIFTAALGKMTSDNSGQVPVNWNVYCSIGGGERSFVKKIVLEPLPGTNTYSLMNLNGGTKEVCIDLPDEIAGKDDVRVILEAASSEAIDWTTGEFTAIAAQNVAQRFCFGSIAVKYNK
ncbi:MAG: BACON domain-containing protein [Candidatus Cryptobacteroides sp.]